MEGVKASFQFGKKRRLVLTLANSNQCSEGFPKYRKDQVSMAIILLGMRHLSASKYGHNAARNAAPAHRSVLEQVASLNSHSTAIGTIIGRKPIGSLFM